MSISPVRTFKPAASLALLLLASASFLIFAGPAKASPPGFVSASRGIAVCWQATDPLYLAQITRAQTLWNQAAGTPLVASAEASHCLPNWTISIDKTTRGSDVVGTEYDGDQGWRGDIVLYARAIKEFKGCEKWAPVHEIGHALGLDHDRSHKKSAVMSPFCNIGMKGNARPKKPDLKQFYGFWAAGPRGHLSDLDLSLEGLSFYFWDDTWHDDENEALSRAFLGARGIFESLLDDGGSSSGTDDAEDLGDDWGG